MTGKDPNLSYSKLHEKMIRHTFLRCEQWLNQGQKDIAEYDVQYDIYKFLKYADISSGVTVEREREGKVDLVVKNDKGVVALIELKSYFKKKEVYKKKEHFEKDLLKLYSLLTSLKKPHLKDARAYLIFAGLSKKFRPAISEERLWAEKAQKRRNFFTYHIDGQKINLRPSTAEINGITSVYSWEIKPK
jgi:hypothetical protein